jgi:hypothetical protein
MNEKFIRKFWQTNKVLQRYEEKKNFSIYSILYVLVVGQRFIYFLSENPKISENLFLWSNAIQFVVSTVSSVKKYGLDKQVPAN